MGCRTTIASVNDASQLHIEISQGGTYGEKQATITAARKYVFVLHVHITILIHIHPIIYLPILTMIYMLPIHTLYTVQRETSQDSPNGKMLE